MCGSPPGEIVGGTCAVKPVIVAEQSGGILRLELGGSPMPAALTARVRVTNMNLQNRVPTDRSVDMRVRIISM